MESDWIEYKCKSGKTVFLYNKLTGEHKWPPGCENGPPEDSIMYGQPVEYKVLISISTQTDDHGCHNGCTSMYINTDHVSSITEPLPQSQPGATMDDQHDLDIQHDTGNDGERDEQCHTMNVVIYNRAVLANEEQKHGQNRNQSIVREKKFMKDIKQEALSNNQDEQTNDLELVSQTDERDQCNRTGGSTIPCVLEKDGFYSGYHAEQSKPVVYYTDNGDLHRKQFQEQLGYNLPNNKQVPDNDAALIPLHNNMKHGKDLLRCSYCLKGFKCKSALTVHIRVHTGESPFQCPHCDKKWKQQSDLNKHLRIHTKVKPFSCSFCGKAFSRKDHLNEHTSTHTGVKPYECYHCKKRFAQKCNLNGHLKLHSGLKPFECTVCGKSFAEKGNLKKHHMTHTGEKPFECSVCSRKFTRRQDMETHGDIHSGLKPFQCPHCQMQFRQRKALNKHITVHDIADPVAVIISANCIAVDIEESATIQAENHIEHSERSLNADRPICV